MPLAQASRWLPCIDKIDDGSRVALADHFLRLSPDSRLSRFTRSVSDAYLVDYANRAFQGGNIVLAATIGDTIRGVAEILPTDGTGRSAEVAFSVDDEWQGHGIGTALMVAMIASVAARGFTKIQLSCKCSNFKMQKLAAVAGMSFERDDGDFVGAVPVAIAAELAQLPVV